MTTNQRDKSNIFIISVQIDILMKDDYYHIQRLEIYFIYTYHDLLLDSIHLPYTFQYLSTFNYHSILYIFFSYLHI